MSSLWQANCFPLKGTALTTKILQNVFNQIVPADRQHPEAVPQARHDRQERARRQSEGDPDERRSHQNAET